MSNSHEQRAWISDPTILSRYLPESVVQRLLEATAAQARDIDLKSHAARLQTLLQTIVSYVPEHAEAAQRARPSARLGLVRHTYGTLLAADLSGFTAFSARLSTLGSEGSELVARTVSTLFSTLLETLADWSGNLLKLSGDALTVLFSGPDHVRRATTAGLELQKRMQAFQSLATPAGVFALSIRIGLASGNVVLAEVGSLDRIELLVAGATARRVMEIQRQASPGAVVVGSAAYHELAPICEAVTLSSGLYRVLSVEQSTPPVLPQPICWVPREDPAWEVHALIGRIEALRPYLVDQYLERLAAGQPALSGEGDLRPVTVLFACLADAGALLENASPDDQALARFQNNVQRLWAIIEQHGGTINKLDLHREGHTLIVLFGAPITQGRDTERAVSCALALLRELGASPGDAGAAPLHVRRVGLATGRVFAGAVGSAQRREYTVMGSVANLAARLMDVAAEGQALIDVATARVVEQLVQLQKQPPVLVKGYEQPVPFYLVEANQPPRLSSLLRDQAPLIGRAAEFAQAQAAVARALAGQGGVVALLGEAGIGKSRLLGEIARLSLVAAVPGPAIVVAQAQPYSRVQPYSVIAEVLWQLYDLPRMAEAAANALIVQARRSAPGHERFLPLVPALFGLHGEESPLTQALTADERRARLQDLVVDLLLDRARAAPLALVLEDLHWADSASADMLGALAVASQNSPLLLLGTYRTEGAPTWPAEAALTSIELQPLTPEQSQALIGSWMGSVALSEELRAAVIERTLGNPFFIEEITRSLRERDLVTDNEPLLPATIQGALLARLDKLAIEERYVLQTASVIGPLFERSLLASVTGGRVALGQTLERLAALALVRPVGEDRYAFAHNLTQETAYESLLFAQRREIHHAIAQHLRAGNGAAADPGILAFHYRRAEDWPQALEYAWQAGLRTQSLYAGEIALGHYRQALDAANRIDDPAAARRHPAILGRIGGLHTLAGRYAEAIAAYTSALANSAEPHERAEVLIAWAELCEQQAAYEQALTLLDQAATLTSAGDEALELRIRVRRGWVLIRRGSADEARTAIEPYLDRLERQQRWEDLLLTYKIFFQIALDQSRWREAHSYLRLALNCAQKTGDIREIARIYNNLGVVLGQEGALHDSAKSFEQAAQVMEEIGDQYNLALFKGNLGGIYYKLGDFANALEQYHSSLRIATAIGNLSIESTVHSNLGELYRRLRQLNTSLDHLLRSVELCQQIDDDLGLTEAYRQLAETYIALDQISDAQAAADQAYTTAIAARDLQSEAIAYRVRGMLAAQRGDYETALQDAGRSIRMLTELGSTHELGQSLMIQAIILAQDAQPDTACHLLEEAIQLLKRSGAIADLAEAQQQLNRVRTYTQELQP